MNGHAYPRYERSKPSGGEWLGAIPSHWDVRKLKTFTRRVRRQGWADEQLLSVYRDHGVVPFGQIEGNHNRPSDDLSSYQLVEVGNLVLNKMKTWQGSLAVSDHRGIVSPAYIVCQVERRVYGRFLHYLLRSPVYIAHLGALSYGVRVDQWDLRFEDFREIEALLPSHAEQEAIAAFLDRETARIDALIEKLERLIERLEEKQKALISHAVTQGLNPNAKMKDSGVEWLGRIPEHWGRTQIRRLARFVTSGSRGWAEHYRENGAMFLRICNLTRNSIRVDTSDVQRVDPPPGAEGERTRILAGDLLFSITAYLGSVAVATQELEQARAYVSQHIALVRLIANVVLPQYVAYAALADVGQNQLAGQAYGGTKVQLALGDVKNVWMPVPPMREQHAIVMHLDDANAKTDSVIARVKLMVVNLREKRTALISAAVTGKIRVGEQAALTSEQRGVYG